MVKRLDDIIIYIYESKGCINANLMKQIIEMLYNSGILKENIKFRCDSDFTHTIDIVQNYFGRPSYTLSGHETHVVKQIITDLNNSEIKKVFVYGLSSGGTGVNRIAYYLNLNIHDNLDKLHMATFGSVLLIPELNSIPELKKIKIFNYISISDIALNLNKKIKPIEYNKLTETLQINNIIYCKLQTYDPNSSIIQICLYNDGSPLCINKVSIINWNEHNGYPNLMYYLMESHCVNIYELIKVNPVVPVAPKNSVISETLDLNAAENSVVPVAPEKSVVSVAPEN